MEWVSLTAGLAGGVLLKCGADAWRVMWELRGSALERLGEQTEIAQLGAESSMAAIGRVDAATEAHDKRLTRIEMRLGYDPETQA